MGCSASVRRKVSSPEVKPRGDSQTTKPAPPTLQECSPELLQTVKDLGLEAGLPNLRSLGVRTLEDVAELLVSDLEEAGLSRVQVRQLQRAAQGGASGSVGVPTARAAFTPAWAPTTSPPSAKAGLLKASQEGSATEEASASAVQAVLSETSVRSLSWVEKSDRSPFNTPLESEALDVLSADSASETLPRAATLARSGAAHGKETTAKTGLGSLAGSSRGRPERTSNTSAAQLTPPDQETTAKTALGSLACSFPGRPDRTANTSAAQPSPHHQDAGTVASLHQSAQVRAATLPSASGKLQDLSAGTPSLPPAPLESTLLPQREEEAPALERTLASSPAPVSGRPPLAVRPVRPAQPARGDWKSLEVITKVQATADCREKEAEPETEQTLLSSPDTRNGPPGTERSVFIPSPESEPAPEEDPICSWVAGLRGGDDEGRPRSRPSSWHEVMLRQQPDQLQEGPVGNKLPEAVRRRLDQRAEQRSHSRGGRNQAGPNPAPYQQQLSQLPCSSPPAQRQGASPVVQRSTSTDVITVRGQALQGKKPVAEKAIARSQSASSPGGRQMFDKNALRKIHRDLFIAGIRQYRQQALQIEPEGQAPGPDLAVCTLRPAPDPVRVYVRKRPLFEKEESVSGEFDVATVVPGRPLPTQLILHSCLFQADLKTPYISHLHFEYDHVFREGAQDHEVYRVAACELVRSVREGGSGTMFMFGQTGSGKTHTMTAIEGMAAHDLFEGASGDAWVSLQFIELCGNHCFDLLAGGGKDRRPELRLREFADGCYAAEGAVLLHPKGPQELCAALRTAHARRATSATDANATSSRSHAICTLKLRLGGQLILADCAGTERRKDSMFHSKERQQEGAEINASLHALKECVRFASSRQRVPPHAFRASALTKVLSGAFQQTGNTQLAVICTVSPCAMDTEHTLATLRTGLALSGRAAAEVEEKEVLSLERVREVHPKQWDPGQVVAWLSKAGGAGRFSDVKDGLPTNFTGQMLVRLTESRCAQLCGGDAKRGRQLFELLHQEIRKVEESRRPT